MHQPNNIIIIRTILRFTILPDSYPSAVKFALLLLLPLTLRNFLVKCVPHNLLRRMGILGFDFDGETCFGVRGG